MTLCFVTFGDDLLFHIFELNELERRFGNHSNFIRYFFYIDIFFTVNIQIFKALFFSLDILLILIGIINGSSLKKQDYGLLILRNVAYVPAIKQSLSSNCNFFFCSFFFVPFFLVLLFKFVTNISLDRYFSCFFFFSLQLNCYHLC